MKRAIALVATAILTVSLQSCKPHMLAMPVVSAKHEIAVGLVTGAIAHSSEDVTVTHQAIQLVLIDVPTFSYFIVLGVYLTVLIIARTRNRALTVID